MLASATHGPPRSPGSSACRYCRASAASSVRIRCPAPEPAHAPPPGGAPGQSPARSAPGSRVLAGKVQWITRALSAEGSRPACRTRAFETTGLSSVTISVWLLNRRSSTFFRLPKRVFRLITRCSRKRVDRRVGDLAEVLPEEVAERAVTLPTARPTGVSSPIEPMASLASSAIGMQDGLESPRPNSPPRSDAGARSAPV